MKKYWSQIDWAKTISIAVTAIVVVLVYTLFNHIGAIAGALGKVFYYFSSFFAGAAINNVILGLMNLMLISNLDGMNIMGELLGIENFVEKAKKALTSRKFRKMLIRKGTSGKATVTACAVICIAQIALPIIIAINIMGVFGWTV